MALIVDTATADLAAPVVDPVDPIDPAPTGDDSSLPPVQVERTGRRPSFYDITGLAFVAFVMMLVTEYAVDNVEGGLERLPWLHHMTVVFAAATAAGVLLSPVAHRTRPLAIPARFAELFCDPPGDWATFLLGMALGLPLLGLFTPTILGDADSVRIVAAVRHVQRDGTGFLTDTQDNLLPHVILGPAAALGGIEAVRVVTIITLQALAGVVALVSQRITGSMWAAVFGVAGLLSIPVVVDRAVLVPMYPTMLAFGYLAGWLAYRAMTEPRAWKCVLGAGLCFVLGMEAQSVGQLFLVTPVLLLVVARDFRRGALGLVYVYAATLAVLIPRIWINVQVGGWSRLTSNRTDYWINKGYVQKIQVDLWHYVGVDEAPGTYVEKLPGRFVESLGVWGWLGFAAAALAVVGLKGRARLLPVAAVAFMGLAATAKGVPPFGRYFSPLWPGAGILAGMACAWFIRQRFKLLKPLGIALGLVLIAGSVNAYDRVAHKSQRLETNMRTAVYRDFVPLIDDGKGVIGSRSHILVNYTADIPTFGGQFLTEDEYVTFLTWPSDAEVVDLLHDHDIGWVLVNANLILEIEYHNTWLVPNHGKEAVHVLALASSPWFCRVASKHGYTLYQVQEPGDPPCQWELPPELPRPARDPDQPIYGTDGPPFIPAEPVFPGPGTETGTETDKDRGAFGEADDSGTGGGIPTEGSGTTIPPASVTPPPLGGSGTGTTTTTLPFPFGPA
jgi:hypothetical protein